MKFAEGLLYEAVVTALGCGTVGDGKSAARYDLRVLVMDQVPYGPYVPVRQPVVTPLIRVCHYSAVSARIFIGCRKMLGTLAPGDTREFLKGIPKNTVC